VSYPVVSMQPPPRPPSAPETWPDGVRAPPAPTDAKAAIALVLGLLSVVATFCWLGLPFGIPAIVLGALAHGDIRRSQGMSGGRGMATAGMVLGAIGSALFLGWMGFLAYAVVHSSMGTAAAPPPPAALAPTAAAPPPIASPGSWGRIDVVDLSASPEPLRARLAEEVTTAREAGETVLVQTTAAACVACGEIARSMRDPALQAALADVRLVRIDAGELGAELPSMRMKEPALPWFYLLDGHGAPRDGISADEWDDNDAESIAPVLEAFVRGKLRSRRRPWRGTML
jgi:hypothetical protein